MSMTRDDYKKKLNEIKTAAEENAFQLDDNAKRNLLIATEGLLIILDHMDDEKLLNGTSLYLADGALEKSPLHLENHVTGPKRENALFETLYGPFVSYYDYFKDLGNKEFQVYCSKMRGYCLESRTRDPFSYGMSMMLGLDLNEVTDAEAKYDRYGPSIKRNDDLFGFNQETTSTLPQAIAVPFYLIDNIPDFTEEELKYNFSYQPPAKPSLSSVNHIRISDVSLPQAEVYVANKTNKQIHNLLKHHGFFAGDNIMRSESFFMAVNSNRKEYRDYVRTLTEFNKISPETWDAHHSNTPKMK